MSIVSLPQFTSLDPASFVNRLDTLLQNNLQQINTILTQNNAHYTWDNLMHPLEDMDDILERFWSPLAHLHAVVNSKALRECYQACLPKLSAYEAAIGHNHDLYDAVKSLTKETLDSVQQKIVEDTLRDFELAGVALSAEKKQRFEAIQTRLSELSNQFENNVLDATQAFSLPITDETRVAGLPEHALHAAAELAKEKGLSGWMFNLEFPCYIAIITYADDRVLRETFYEAYATRASEQGPQAGKFDNSKVMSEILALRHEKAQLLGFANYAELSLATKMAESPKQVIDFLMDLSIRAHHQAETEFQELQEFAQKHYGITKLEPWDVTYISEKKDRHSMRFHKKSYAPIFLLLK